MAQDFWRNSGFHLLTRNAAGHLELSDDFLRAYYLRPEVHPVEESCEAERALHAALMDAPRHGVAPQALEAIVDTDARDNYRVVLRFRDRLLSAGTLEASYLRLFQGAGVDVPPMFVDQLAHAILRNVLDGCEDPLQLRAAELFFREQRVTLQDGQVLLADREIVEMHANGSQYGSLGRLIVEAKGSLGRVDLDVLERENADLYWSRESRHDTVLRLNHGSPGADALVHAHRTRRRVAGARDRGVGGAFSRGGCCSAPARAHRRTALGLACRARCRSERHPERPLERCRGGERAHAAHPCAVSPAVR